MNLLAKQKSDLFDKSQKEKEEAIMALFAYMAEKDYSKTNEFEAALAALEAAHKEIDSISTWPWNNETIRQLAGAVLLPISIWLIQYFLAILLGN